MQRVDIGLRREWRLHGWTAGRGVTTAITVENLFNYPNALSLSGNDSGGDLRLVRARPRGVRLELGWGF
jgi:hypothetical protein